MTVRIRGQINTKMLLQGRLVELYLNTAMVECGSAVHLITFDGRTIRDELETVVKILEARVADD